MMQNRIRALLKSLIGEKNSLKAVSKLIIVSVGYISSIYTFAVLLKNWVGYTGLEDACKEKWYILILVGIAASLIHNHEKLTLKFTDESTGLQIIVTVNDLFAAKASSFVIPTNTGFITRMAGDFISPKSVQGAFQLKYFKNNPNELDKKIHKQLSRPEQRYPIGKTVKIDHREKHYYLLAICDVNESGKPEHQSMLNVNMALRGLTDYITKYGHCDVLAMPLIGTGKAAIKGATIGIVLEETIKQFKCSSKKVVETLIICINPKDYLDGRIDMKKIEGLFNYLTL